MTDAVSRLTEAVAGLTEKTLEALRQQHAERSLGSGGGPSGGSGAGAGTHPVGGFTTKASMKADMQSSSVSSMTDHRKLSPDRVSFSSDTKSGDGEGSLVAAAAASEVSEAITNPHYSQDSFSTPPTDSEAATHNST